MTTATAAPKKASNETVALVNSIWDLLALLNPSKDNAELAGKIAELTTFAGEYRSDSELRAVNLRLKEQFRKPEPKAKPEREPEGEPEEMF